MARLGLLACLLPLATGLASATGQERPTLYNEEEYGRPMDGTVLRVCIDSRDPASEIDEAIVREIASVLLLEPEIHVVADVGVTSPFDDVYYHLRANCRAYFGFKLIAELYPTWVAVTRPYYEANYVFVTHDPSISRLADLPPGTPVGATAASSADFQFIQYNNLQPAGQRWRRLPFGTDAQSLEALDNGTVAAALVWGPSLLTYKGPGLSFIAPDPVRLAPMPVGALVLSDDTFLRQTLDEAIAALIREDIIDELLADYDFLSAP